MVSALRSRAALAVAAVCATVAAGMATPVLAAGGVPGQRMTVCADDLIVRSDIPERGGHYIGMLHRGETFRVDFVSPQGGWAEGFAFGQVNQNGWVENGWFC